MTAIAVDFGSSNTVVAWWNVAREAPESLHLPPLARPAPFSHLIPSQLFVRDARQGQVEIGQPAIDAGRFQRDPRHFARIKRYLTAGVGFEPEIDGVRLPPERVGQWFIHALFQHLANRQAIPSEICLTAPVQAGERYLRWLEACHAQALQYPKAPRVRTLDEPTAAALGYEAAAPGSVVLVVDFGGGTLDLSLVRLPRSRDTARWGQFLDEGDITPDRQVELIAKTGQMLGGEDIDRWLLEDFAARMGFAPPQASEPLLRSLMERVKIALSSQEEATEAFFDPQRAVAWEIAYTRGELLAILQQRGFFRVLKTAIDEVVQRAALRGTLKLDIQAVLLVGGTTLIPAVRECVASIFPRAALFTDIPFEAIAHGALRLTRFARLRDRLFHTYALRWWDRRTAQWQYQAIVQRGQIYPTARPYELTLQASRPDQDSIDLLVGELETRPAGSAEIVFEGDCPLVVVEQAPKQVFIPLLPADRPQAVIPLNPVGQPGTDRLKVLFDVSDRRQLRISVIDLLAGKTLMRDCPVAELH